MINETSKNLSENDVSESISPDAATTAEEPTPPRSSSVHRRIWSFSTHEWTLAALGSVVLAIVMTWPTAVNITTTIPEDIYDPLLEAWQIAWGGHALLTDPTNLWNANAFYPDALSLAYSDNLLGYAPLGMIGSGPEAAVARYNVLFILLHALAFFGAYALTRQLGARIPGALVAGMAFGYAPWRLSQAGHMHILSTGGIALTLAMLARGHGFSFTEGYRPERIRIGWIAAGWAVACWQISISFGIGIPFGYALLAIGVVCIIGWLVRRRPPVPRRVLVANLIGGLVFALFTAFLALPYLRVAEANPNAERSEGDLALFSPTLRGLVTAPVESWLWGDSHAPARVDMPYSSEMALLVGFALLGLALAGLAYSVWRVRTRLWLAGATVLAVYLTLGTNAWAGGKFGYLLLFRFLPGMEAIRTPGRMVLWVTLLMGILAAGTVSAMTVQASEWIKERQPRREVGWLVRVALLLPALLLVVESWNRIPHPEVPKSPLPFGSVQGPLIVMPSNPLLDQSVMLWSTDGFPKMINGGSGFYPKRQEEIRIRSGDFPNAETVQYLRGLGIKTVIVLPDLVTGTGWAAGATRTGEGLGIERRVVGDTIVFTL
ncbi:MAG: hypothetical protein H0T78_03420 [Longispora sp.]|nr:hypothetical protein [Longispora sp. (in: high G+C Gram-positive bacteria)]